MCWVLLNSLPRCTWEILYVRTWLLWGDISTAAGEYCRGLVLLRYLEFVVDSIGVSRVYLLKKTKEKSQISSATAIGRGARWVPAAAPSGGPGRRAQPRCQSRLLFLLPAQSDNGGKMFSTCGDVARGVGSIAGALISVGIVRINGSCCRVCCLFPQFLVLLPSSCYKFLRNSQALEWVDFYGTN